MIDIMIRGIPVSFPFAPYDVQKEYMEKVIDCLQNGHNGVLESPTGTGKTLSLLCSSLAWLLVKKAQIQVGIQTAGAPAGGFLGSLENSLKNAAGKQSKSDGAANWGTPKIIYASRTHSQLTQAMQELKRSNYKHVKAAILGSRDQMCIHPEISKEINNTVKINLCQAKVKTRTCFYYTNVDSKKEDASVKDNGILDIEDLVKVGKKLTCCPYYLAKELKQNADIIFMPYNYLLDPKARKANGVELTNNIIILDEAHNIERMCEEAASLQIKSTDIALCIEEVTHMMKTVSENTEEGFDFSTGNENSQPKDFTPDDLCTLKGILLSLEKAIDEIAVTPGDGITFDGSYIFEILMKAQICENNSTIICNLVENLVQFLTTSSNASPFQRKGSGLQKFADLLNVTFSSNQNVYKKRIMESYKVHVHIEDKKMKKSDSWSVIKGPTKTNEIVLSYWCFSPGFGMKQLLDQQVRSIILTSGTLAPLKPLISELGIPIQVRLENPHIVADNQVFVKIIGQGPDAQTLNSNFENRNNPKYIESLGRTILSFTRVVPDGLLVFFPSYPILAKCQETWQLSGIWTSICDIKQIYVEPQRKDTFNATMTDFYSKINDVASRGACFMAVCRGKVSEGLDFADMNGRAVIITGLPFPPFKDPRIILKKRYLEEQRLKDKDYLSGDEWYSLEASRAVNQAIGRVIRHKNDYGAILLCDTRFNNPRLKNQLSAWLRNRCAVSTKFGETVGELCRFFKSAEKDLPSPRLKPLNPNVETTYDFSMDKSMPSVSRRIVPKKKTSIVGLQNVPKSNEVISDIAFYRNAKNCVTKPGSTPQKASDLFSALDMANDVIIETKPSTSMTNNDLYKRERSSDQLMIKNKKKKYRIVLNGFGIEKPENVLIDKSNIKIPPENLLEFVKCVKSSLDKNTYKEFQSAVSLYKNSNNYEGFINILDKIFFPLKNLHYLLVGMERFLKDSHKVDFKKYCEKLH